jgi:hypothetical protein
MHIIRHDHIAADGDVEFVGGAKGVFPKRVVNNIEPVHLHSMQRAKSNKEKRRIVGLEDLLQSGRTTFDHRQSGEAVGRTIFVFTCNPKQ